MGMGGLIQLQTAADEWSGKEPYKCQQAHIFDFIFPVCFADVFFMDDA